MSGESEGQAWTTQVFARAHLWRLLASLQVSRSAQACPRLLWLREPPCQPRHRTLRSIHHPSFGHTSSRSYLWRVKPVGARSCLNKTSAAVAGRHRRTSGTSRKAVHAVHLLDPHQDNDLGRKLWPKRVQLLLHASLQQAAAANPLWSGFSLAHRTRATAAAGCSRSWTPMIPSLLVQQRSMAGPAFLS